MSAAIITFPRPFRPSREQRREAAIDGLVRVLIKYDKRKEGEKAIRASVLAYVADMEATVRASRERGEG
jgi:hypothetical protein